MYGQTEQAGRSKAGDFMDRDPRVISYDATMADAARAIAESLKGGVVVTSGPDVMGVIADVDIARLIAGGRDLGRTPVRDFLSACMLTGTQPCIQVREDELLLNVMRVIENYGVDMVLVVDGSGRFVGTINAIQTIKGWVEEVYGASSPA